MASHLTLVMKLFTLWLLFEFARHSLVICVLRINNLRGWKLIHQRANMGNFSFIALRASMRLNFTFYWNWFRWRMMLVGFLGRSSIGCTSCKSVNRAIRLKCWLRSQSSSRSIGKLQVLSQMLISMHLTELFNKGNW